MKRLSKSRYATISAYICNHKGGRDPHSSTTLYNDIPCEVDDATKATLEAGGVDSILATHLAHLWTRDPLVIFKERIEIDDETLSDHFENIQSTNWQSVRWKPPPPTPSNPNNIGWCVRACVRACAPLLSASRAEVSPKAARAAKKKKVGSSADPARPGVCAFLCLCPCLWTMMVL